MKQGATPERAGVHPSVLYRVCTVMGGPATGKRLSPRTIRRDDGHVARESVTDQWRAAVEESHTRGDSSSSQSPPRDQNFATPFLSQETLVGYPPPREDRGRDDGFVSFGERRYRGRRPNSRWPGVQPLHTAIGGKPEPTPRARGENDSTGTLDTGAGGTDRGTRDVPTVYGSSWGRYYPVE